MTVNPHPTQYSPEVLEILARLLTRGERIHDPFAGTGIRLGKLADDLGSIVTMTDRGQRIMTDHDQPSADRRLSADATVVAERLARRAKRRRRQSQPTASVDQTSSDPSMATDDRQWRLTVYGSDGSHYHIEADSEEDALDRGRIFTHLVWRVEWRPVGQWRPDGPARRMVAAEVETPGGDETCQGD